MIATAFGRDYCKVGSKQMSYAELRREYRCSACGGRLILAWCKDTGWLIKCGCCNGQDFIHEYKYERQQHEAAEVLDGLPQELAALVN